MTHSTIRHHLSPLEQVGIRSGAIHPAHTHSHSLPARSSQRGNGHAGEDGNGRAAPAAATNGHGVGVGSAGAALAAFRKRLSPEDNRILTELLAKPMPLIDSPAFREPDASVRIYEKSIAKPDIGWYQPLMDRLTRSPNQSVTTGTIKPLSSAEERVLFHQFNYAKHRIREIQAELGMIEEGASPSAASGGGGPAVHPPTESQAREMLRWFHKAEELRVQIAESNIALVIAMARRTRIRDLEFADLVSEGNMALLRSIEKFNVDYGNKFSTYACQSILKAFSRLGVKHSRYRERFPVEFDPEREMASPLNSRRADLDRDCADQLSAIVAENRAGLTDVEMAVVKHRFGLGGPAGEEVEGLTLGQVGQMIGVGKERVRQIQVKALAKIRRELETRFLYRSPSHRGLGIDGAAGSGVDGVDATDDRPRDRDGSLAATAADEELVGRSN